MKIRKLYFYIFIVLCFVIFVYSTRQHNNIYVNEKMQNENRICCIYSYYEKNEKYINNFKFFISNAILDNVHYYIVINGSSTVEIPDKHNIHVYTRENKGSDFGAYSYALKQFDPIYEYYFFINNTVIGPYLDKYNLQNDNKDWTTYFIDLFNTDDVKIVGTSINILENTSEYYNKLIPLYGEKNVYSHIQSMFFCINKEYLRYLQSIDFFNEEILNDKDREYLILQKEIGISQYALNNNWNINSILDGYKNLDYRKISKNINESASSYSGDPYFKNTYFGKTITENDAIFLKNNRG